MSKLLIIPDIHGEDFWKDIYELDLDQFEKIIFLGDLTDSFFITDEQMIKNTEEVIEFVKNHRSKTILLWGNHDLSYYDPNKFKCSGYNKNIANKLNKLYRENKDLFKLVYEYEHFIFSHAGISKTWLEEVNEAYLKDSMTVDITTLYELNKLVDLLFTRGLLYNTKVHAGDKTSSCVWMRTSEWNTDTALFGKHQVVGHTPDKKNPNTMMFTKHPLDLSKDEVAKITILDRSAHKQMFILDTENESFEPVVITKSIAA